jgi:hypothetical protein
VEHLGQNDQRDPPELFENQPPVALPLPEQEVRTERRPSQPPLHARRESHATDLISVAL